MAKTIKKFKRYAHFRFVEGERIPPQPPVFHINFFPSFLFLLGLKKLCAYIFQLFLFRRKNEARKHQLRPEGLKLREGKTEEGCRRPRGRARLRRPGKMPLQTEAVSFPQNALSSSSVSSFSLGTKFYPYAKSAKRITPRVLKIEKKYCK